MKSDIKERIICLLTVPFETEKSDGGRAWRIEALGGGVSAVVSREHNFGTDALLPAYFAEPKNIDRVCDLGTGCGIIPFTGAPGRYRLHSGGGSESAYTSGLRS